MELKPGGTKQINLQEARETWRRSRRSSAATESFLTRFFLLFEQLRAGININIYAH